MFNAIFSNIFVHRYYELELFREMATMGELPSELLSYIILMLVQSPGGAADFARIVSVCRRFRLFTQDKHILNLVNFDMKMEFKNFIQYQHINNLLVKCSEAGNEAAQFLLGKVILVSSSQLFLGEWQKADFHPCDFFTLACWTLLKCRYSLSVTSSSSPVLPKKMIYSSKPSVLLFLLLKPSEI
ncbi:uncharacterized protein LOC141716659 isoform X3 [Apium graveolens]|uniref:uncharacterized protein LOC141716659 isoform X3 n=1 Tax=Apium graveolens TaxID=4045 RepID=UPI003D7A3570